MDIKNIQFEVLVDQNPMIYLTASLATRWRQKWIWAVAITFLDHKKVTPKFWSKNITPTRFNWKSNRRVRTLAIGYSISSENTISCETSLLTIVFYPLHFESGFESNPSGSLTFFGIGSFSFLPSLSLSPYKISSAFKFKPNGSSSEKLCPGYCLFWPLFTGDPLISHCHNLKN